MVRHVLMTADAMGGVWTYALALARSLARAGVRTTLATMGEPPRAAQRESAAAVPGLSLHESAYALEWMNDAWDDVRAAGDWLLRLESDERPDIVHVNGYAHGQLPWTAPVVVVAHSCVFSWWLAVEGGLPPPRYGRYRDAVTAGLAHANAIVAPTRWMLDAVRAHYGGFACPAFVIPNGLEGGGARHATSKEPLVLGVGRAWDRAKNIAALDAVAGRVKWPVAVAGPAEGPDGQRVALGRARALGWLDRPAIDEWMARAAIFAAPARYEPFGLVALEAALHGCALVLGEIPSLREVWGPAATYAPPDDLDHLACAIERLAHDPTARARAGAMARDRALSYGADAMAGRYLAVYAAARAGTSARADAEGACA
jgi:glycosyltransferase involved in cell wall biosynthesis